MARIPGIHPSEGALARYEPLTMAAGEPKAQGREGNSDGDGLHERLYQRGSVQWRGHRNGSEVFHAPGPPFHGAGGHQTSEAGVWSSGRGDSVSGGVFKRRHSLWFVADAQLIVYGATNPAAQLTICGKPCPSPPMAPSALRWPSPMADRFTRSRIGSEAPQVSRLNCLPRCPLLAPDFKHRRSRAGVS